MKLIEQRICRENPESFEELERKSVRYLTTGARQRAVKTRTWMRSVLPHPSSRNLRLDSVTSAGGRNELVRTVCVVVSA